MVVSISVQHHSEVPSSSRHGVVALGNFDGVHKGHQQVLAHSIAISRDLDAPPLAVTFDPHPRRFFKPHESPFLLTDLTERERAVLSLGMEALVALRFDEALSRLSPEAFIDTVLHQALRARAVVVGADFVFGRGRTGTAKELIQHSAERGMRAETVDLQLGPDGERYSSSGVRKALRSGDVREAARMLGRPWAVRGPVLRGDQRGRTIGFPTANLNLGELVRPRRGVYAVCVELETGARYDGVANCGRRPTIGDDRELMEAYLFDFSGDLYGRPIRIELMEFIRDEQRFDGLDALKAQIGEDMQTARRQLAALR